MPNGRSRPKPTKQAIDRPRRLARPRARCATRARGSEIAQTGGRPPGMRSSSLSTIREAPACRARLSPYNAGFTQNMLCEASARALSLIAAAPPAPGVTSPPAGAILTGRRRGSIGRATCFPPPGPNRARGRSQPAEIPAKRAPLSRSARGVLQAKSRDLRPLAGRPIMAGGLWGTYGPRRSSKTTQPRRIAPMAARFLTGRATRRAPRAEPGLSKYEEPRK